MDLLQTKIDLEEKRALLATKTDEATKSIEARDIELAKTLKAEIDVIQEEVTVLANKVAELTGEEDEQEDETNDAKEKEVELENKTKETEQDSEERNTQIKGEDIKMETRQVIVEGNEERDAFKSYLETREVAGDNLKVDSGFVVVPEDVQNEIYKLQNTMFNLEQYVRVKSVTHQAGDYPIVKLNTLEGLPTVAELEENPALAVQALNKVAYKIVTHRGFYRVSQEVIEDGFNVFAELNEYIAVLVNNTRNKAIIDAIKNGTKDGEAVNQKFVEKDVTTLDGLKKILNVDLAPHYVHKTAITNQNGFHQLDTLKDSSGRYLLQDDIKSASGKSLLGAPVVVVSNELLKDKAGKSPVIFGDLEEGLTMFKRSEYQAKWEDFMHFGSGIMTAVRQDVRVVDKEAVIIANIKIEAPEVEPVV